MAYPVNAIRGVVWSSAITLDHTARWRGASPPRISRPNAFGRKATALRVIDGLWHSPRTHDRVRGKGMSRNEGRFYHDPLSALASAIESRAPIDEIERILNYGLAVAFREVMDPLDDAIATLPADDAWLTALLTLPDIQDGLAIRQTALDAASAMKDALVVDDLVQVQSLLRSMLDAQFDAAYDLGDGSVLKWAVVHQVNLGIMELLLTEGEGNFSWLSCPDAREALDATPNGPWKASVNALRTKLGWVG